MKGISSLNVLQQELELNNKVWLLLVKKGSIQSDCALANFEDSGKKEKKDVLCIADVNEVKDIHPRFNVTSVPTLLYFEDAELKNIVKGCQSAEQYSTILNQSAYVWQNGKENKPAKNVTVYTTPTCSWCTTVKRHLQENGIRYREVDVSTDQKAAELMVKKSGQQGVPQTEINGQIVVGFDKTRINSLLEIK